MPMVASKLGPEMRSSARSYLSFVAGLFLAVMGRST
jgi:hypothetical protein